MAIYMDVKNVKRHAIFGSLSEVLHGNLLVMIITSGIWTFGASFAAPFDTLYYMGLGASYADIGYLTAIWSLSRIFSLVIGGYLADRIGRRRLVAHLSFALASAELYIALIPDWRYAIPHRIYDGFIGGLREPAFSALIADSTPVVKRALAYSAWQILPPMFGLISPIIAGGLIDFYGLIPMMRIFHFITFICGFTASTIRVKYLKETLNLNVKLDTRGSHLSLSLLKNFIPPFKHMNRPLKVWLIMNFTGGIFSSAASPYWVDYAVNVIGLSKMSWGTLDSIRRFENLIVSPTFAALSDTAERFGRLKFIIPTAFISPITNIGFTFSRSWMEVYFWLALATFLSSVSAPASSALFTEYMPRGYRGRIMASFSLINTIASMIGGIVGGYIYGNISKQLVFILLSIVGWINAILILKYFEEPRFRYE
ncbi:MAG: MFS transporter [Candidatus Methanomethylicia archaeon]